MTHLTATRVKIITLEIFFSEVLFCICYILGIIGHIIVNSRQIEFWGRVLHKPKARSVSLNPAASDAYIRDRAIIMR